MSQITKCPNVTVVLTYWEASVEVSELSYKSLLYSISVGSYCSTELLVCFLTLKEKHYFCTICRESIPFSELLKTLSSFSGKVFLIHYFYLSCPSMNSKS